MRRAERDGMQPPVRVLIIDPHHGMRAAMRALLQGESDIAVCGERDDATTLLADGAVDVIIADERGAGVATPAPRTALHELSRRAPVIVVGTGDPAYYAAAELHAGAGAYWSKLDDIDALPAAVRAVASLLGPRVGAANTWFPAG